MEPLGSTALILVMVLGAPTAYGSTAAPPSAEELLRSALAAHDPRGAWPDVCLDLELRETRPEGPDRRSTIRLAPSSPDFRMGRTSGDGPEIRTEITNGECAFSVDGHLPTEAEVEEHRLHCARARMLRDYYEYLWGLPMKLLDTGTRLDPEARSGAFDDRPASILRVTYDADVGSDVWLFYLEPESFQLLGTRFFHDEDAGDGEAIHFAHGVIEPTTGIVFPKERSWFTNRGGEFLGSDVLEDVRPCGNPPP